ncbi:hypothetical protein C8J56DRAFT_560338 [Mycena floridula]|nr:hypothetical protein C8J56DRAFT_560338 [Mycena floridula]
MSNLFDNNFNDGYTFPLSSDFSFSSTSSAAFYYNSELPVSNETFSTISSPSKPAISPKRDDSIMSELLQPSPDISLPFHPLKSDLDNEDDDHSFQCLPLSSPISNPHRGVPIETLTQKALRYRTRHPKEPYDNPWLLQFAGRLSAAGENIDDYRCYVAGCTRTNKRRDHIVTHVGSHLHHKAFQCEICLSQFARKHELKRHEAKHSGVVEHICDQCGKTFARADIKQRHMKKTCKSREKENGRRRKAEKAV